jgi:hypothetical protein
VRGDLVTLVDVAIDAHAEAAGEVQRRDRARSRRERDGILRVHAALDGPPRGLISRLGNSMGSPAAMRICSAMRSTPVTSSVTRVLHLDAGVHLHERQLAVLGQQELERARGDVVAVASARRMVAAMSGAQLVVKATLGDSSSSFWWRRWMEHSRSPSTRTSPLPIGDDLELDVARLFDVALHVEVAVQPKAERWPPACAGLEGARQRRSAHGRSSCLARRRRPRPSSITGRPIRRAPRPPRAAASRDAASLPSARAAHPARCAAKRARGPCRPTQPHVRGAGADERHAAASRRGSAKDARSDRKP